MADVHLYSGGPLKSNALNSVVAVLVFYMSISNVINIHKDGVFLHHSVNKCGTCVDVRRNLFYGNEALNI